MSGIIYAESQFFLKYFVSKTPKFIPTICYYLHTFEHY
jgi:hypothetical protein